MPEISLSWFVAMFVLMVPVAGYSTYECTRSEGRLVEVSGEVTEVRVVQSKKRPTNYASYHYVFEGRGRWAQFRSAEPEKIGAKRRLWIDPERIDVAFSSPEVPCSKGSWWLLALPVALGLIYLRLKNGGRDERST